MPETALAPALRVLLEHVVDYAGLFPPAGLSMHDAAMEYAAQRGSPHAWMLGRFVVPVGRLDELVAEAPDGSRQGAWPLSVLVSADPEGDARAIAAFNRAQRDRFVVQSVELPAASVEAIEWAMPLLDSALERYVEIPLAQDPFPLVQALQRHGARAKARTGGLSADAFPSPELLARFISACARLTVPFKVTAGLHHPVRGEQRLTYDAGSAHATMFGFLNVFVAAAFALAGADQATLAQLLDERDASAFAIERSSLRWRGRSLTDAQLEASRRELAIGFGSCSFREPVADLQQLGLL